MALGTTLTGALGAIRSLINGVALAPFTLDALKVLFDTSIAIGVYLAVSTNLRYQFVAGILEQRIIDPIFKEKYPSALAQGICSAIVRAGNTFIGSLLMIDWLKALGLQG